jgi:hypothetical protein
MQACLYSDADNHTRPVRTTATREIMQWSLNHRPSLLLAFAIHEHSSVVIHADSSERVPGDDRLSGANWKTTIGHCRFSPAQQFRQQRNRENQRLFVGQLSMTSGRDRDDVIAFPQVLWPTTASMLALVARHGLTR